MANSLLLERCGENGLLQNNNFFFAAHSKWVCVDDTRHILADLCQCIEDEIM
jgi:hypothetical protein